TESEPRHRFISTWLTTQLTTPDVERALQRLVVPSFNKRENSVNINFSLIEKYFPGLSMIFVGRFIIGCAE
ncbi:MAG: hypothetical protein JSW50_13075, partial [Candidatus Latescibacterota bacterium]